MTPKKLTKLPDDGAVGVIVSVIGVLLMVLLVDPVVDGLSLIHI